MFLIIVYDPHTCKERIATPVIITIAGIGIGTMRFMAAAMPPEVSRGLDRVADQYAAERTVETHWETVSNRLEQPLSRHLAQFRGQIYDRKHHWEHGGGNPKKRRAQTRAPPRTCLLRTGRRPPRP